MHSRGKRTYTPGSATTTTTSSGANRPFAYQRNPGGHLMSPPIEHAPPIDPLAGSKAVPTPNYSKMCAELGVQPSLNVDVNHLMSPEQEAELHSDIRRAMWHRDRAEERAARNGTDGQSSSMQSCADLYIPGTVKLRNPIPGFVNEKTPVEPVYILSDADRAHRDAWARSRRISISSTDSEDKKKKRNKIQKMFKNINEKAASLMFDEL